MHTMLLPLVALLAPPTTPPDTHASVAVVELFTSEGCSSCPPADDLLTELTREAAHASRPVFTLAFHVDYWNGLGHPDRFSTPGFTQRQHRYASILHDPSVYTPQLIVNGRSGFVGSDRAQARREIDRALTTPARVTLHELAVSFDTAPTAGANTPVSSGLSVRVTTSGLHPGDTVQAAFVEDELQTDVKKGENAGRVLKHSSVVRALESNVPERDGPVTLALTPPADAKLDHARIVVFVQERDTLAVVGAASTAVPAPAKAEPVRTPSTPAHADPAH